MQSSTTYRAKHIVVDSTKVIDNGFLTTSHGLSSGQIQSVGKWAEYPGRKSDVIDLGAAVLLPALVNSHTHLEFSDQQQPIGSSDGSFAGWIQQVIAQRIQLTGSLTAQQREEVKRASCRQGWQECRNRGTAGLGEILSFPDLPPLHRQLAGSGDCLLSVYYEVLGLGKDRGDQSFEWAVAACQTAGGTGLGASSDFVAGSSDSEMQVGLSPHAPYSTATNLYRQCADYCIRKKLPLATHLAETVEEIELLEHRSGPLVELFQGMGIWNPAAIEATSIREVLQTVVDVPWLLLIHCNYMLQEDWRWLMAENPSCSIVYCPQTHRYFQHSPHPWPQMLEDGVNVALGTDSRASSPTLSLWDDAILAAKLNPEVDPAKVFKMVTINGARALGIDRHLGSLQPGKRSQVLVAEPDFGGQGFDWAGLVSEATTPGWLTIGEV